MMESWDGSNAFLQGLSSNTLKTQAKKLGMEPLSVDRKVYLDPPPNVWRHFRNNPKSKINIPSSQIPFFVLLLLKPMYGLVDAPLLWQIALASFIVRDLKGIRSCYDENLYYWHDDDGQLAMLWTTHVDDIFAIYHQAIGDWAYKKLQGRFGTLKRQQLPLTHVGVRYERWGSGLLLHQHEFIKSIKPIEISKARAQQLKEALTSFEQHSYRSLLCQLLYATITLVFIHVEVVQLQQHNNSATVEHMLLANRILKRAKAHLIANGLHFPPLKWPLRLCSIADAGHATKNSSFAQEGQLILLTGDTTHALRVEKECVTPGTIQHLGGYAHCMGSRSGKSKRISHSTSHAETLSACTACSTAQMVAMRLTEIYSQFQPIPQQPHLTRLQQLIDMQDRGAYIIPIDHYTDCKDFWELCCGIRGVPSDKSQRLAVLSMREDRLSGRIRNFVLVDTNNMLADGLTKPGTFPELMRFATCGLWQLKPHATRPIMIRKLQKTAMYDESDLVNLKG